MSSSEAGSRTSTPAPEEGGRGARRKSTRAKKVIERLDPSNGKGKRTTAGSDDSDDAPSAAEDDDDEFGSTHESEDDEEDAYKAPKATGSAKKKGGAAAGTGRKPHTSGAAKAKKTPTQRKPRAKKADDGGSDGEEEETKGAKGKASGKDFKIEADNELFNAVKSPNTALQQTAEDWIEQYKDDSGPAMAELVNFVLRCCGCNATVDEHQAEDENGIVENLKDIVDEFKLESNHTYPLISKSKPYKKFRTSLTQFLSKLLTLAADDSLLFESSFWIHFTSWVHALSSSQIRALRHTATVVVLLSVNALSELHVAVKKEHGQAVRAKEAEEKKGRKDKSRLRDMERQVKEVHERLEQVEGFIDEGYTSVFVNRYRDADSVIRAECISALGSWMKVDPDMWIDGDYLRYIGWVLSDESKEARRESVKALFSLYQKDTHIGKLHHFTDRFKQTVVDMAIGEHDLSVRIQAIHVARQIDGHGLLTDKQRDEVAQLVFEREKRVRNAAAEFWQGLVEEEVETRKGELEALSKTPRGRKKGGGKEKEQEHERETMVNFKVLAELLVKYGKELDGGVGVDLEQQEDEESQARRDAVEAEDLALALDGDAANDDATKSVPRGRVAFAVEALWDGVEALRDWQSMLDFLLKDHSTVAEGSPVAPGSSKKKAAAKGKGKGKAQDDDEEEEENEDDEENEAATSTLPEKLKLNEEEEALMIEVLVACLTRIIEVSKSSTSQKAKDQDEEDLAVLSRAVIEALPKLFSKHQTFTGRMVEILAIPRLVNLDLYLDMRQVTAYESLWDDVNKQFLKHTSPAVLDQAVRTLVHFASISNLSATNTSKLAELEDSLISALRTSTAGRDIETVTFEDDEVHALTACVARLKKLESVKNLGNALEETDGGKETSAVDILDAISNRGRLGYKDEAAMVEHALEVLGTHLVWQLQAVVVETHQAGSADVASVLTVAERRQSFLDKLEEFAVGNETNAAEGVKQVALSFLFTIHMLSRALVSRDKDNHLFDLQLTASDELQARCAGYVEAEIERYAEQIAENAAEQEDDEEEEVEDNSDSGSETETEETNKSRSQSQRSKKGKGKKAAKGKKGKKAAPKKQEKRKRKTAVQVRAENLKQQKRLIAAQRFERTVAPFVSAIHTGTFELRHSVVLLKHWGRLGVAFDEQAKLLMHDLRDEGNYGSGGEMVASVVVEALQGACDLYLDAPDDANITDEHLVSLGRNLIYAVVVRGAQLAVVSKLPTEDHLRLHLDACKYAVKKLAKFEEDKRRDERNKLLSFFKALAHLLLGLDGRAALKVKTSLDALLDESSIEVSLASKVWEPLRAYQRRLINTMSKDPSIQKAARNESAKKATSKKTKSTNSKKNVSDDDEDEDDQVDETEDDDEQEQPSASSPAPQKSSRSRRRDPVPISQELGVEPARPTRGTKRAEPEGAAQDEIEEEVEESGAASSSSPRKKQRVEDQSPAAEEREKTLEPQQPSQDNEDEASPAAAAVENPYLDADNGDLGSTVSQSPKKRSRPAEEEEEEVDEGDLGETQTGGDEQEEEELSRSVREASVESTMSLSDLKAQKKKKRRVKQ